jgi:hypothetical protein
MAQKKITPTALKKKVNQPNIPLKGKSVGKSKKKRTERKPRGASRYNEVQKLLSTYAKENNLHLGKDFNRVASRINTDTQGTPIKYVGQNIEVLYKDFGAKAKVEEIPIDFPNNIPFYSFRTELMDVNNFKDSVTVSIVSTLPEAQGSFKGNSMDAMDFFNFNLYKALRQNYSDSPVAMLVIDKTDNLTYVRYVVIANDVTYSPDEVDSIENEVESDSPKESAVDSALEIEREKTKQKEIELGLAREKTKQMELAKDLGLKGNALLKFLGLI